MLPLLNEGLQNGQIADRLVVSVRTVDHHVEAIPRKLGAKTRADARGHRHLARDFCGRLLSWERTGKGARIVSAAAVRGRWCRVIAR